MNQINVENLRISAGDAGLVNGISFSLQPGQSLGIVGESGSGKSLTAMSLIGLLPPSLGLAADRIEVCGQDVLSCSANELRDSLRNRIGLVFQNPMTALNPRLTVGEQLYEVVRLHQSHKDLSTLLDLLEDVGLREPRRVLRQFPHELSGGIAQRVVIALALAKSPELLIADEPTTALDARVQSQILDLLDSLKSSRNLGIILISHDLGVVSDRTENIIVMRKGRIVEEGRTKEILENPSHEYTRSLLAAIPKPSLSFGVSSDEEVMKATAKLLLPPRFSESVTKPIVELHNVSKVFHRKKSFFSPRSENEGKKAVDGVSFNIHEGSSVGLVGESGSGKTTLARMIVGLEEQTSGAIDLWGTSTRKNHGNQKIQYVFQDSASALNPKIKIGESLNEFLEKEISSKKKRISRSEELLNEVELDGSFLDRYPRELSGGQRQRVGIARALGAEPKLLVADEPVSALDVSVQATIINLLNRLRRDHQLTYLIISHDIGVISYLCNQMVVLKSGEIQEEGSTADVIGDPKNTYTKELLASVPGRNL